MLGSGVYSEVVLILRCLQSDKEPSSVLTVYTVDQYCVP